MKYLLFDTETSGLPDYAAPADDPNQPYLAEFAGYLVEQVGDSDEFIVGDIFTFLVKPDGWSMTPEATAVNGLTDEFLLAHGQDIGELLHWWALTIKAGYIATAFNVRHDCKVMRGALRRAGMEDLFESTPNVCLMRSSWRKEIGMTKADGSRRGWPKLEDACRHFGIPFADDHRATLGAQNALAVFMALHKIGMLLEPEVHYAKNRPMPDPQGTLPGTNDDMNF